MQAETTEEPSPLLDSAKAAGLTGVVQTQTQWNSRMPAEIEADPLTLLKAAKKVGFAGTGEQSQWKSGWRISSS